MASMKKGEVRMQIKFVDLAAMNDEIRERVDREMAEIHKNTAYIGGPHVEAFEKEFAEFLGVRHVIGVGSGTDALRLALMAHRRGSRRRSHHHADDVYRDRRQHHSDWRQADLRRCRSGNLQPESDARCAAIFETHQNGNGKPHKQRHSAGASVWPSGRDAGTQCDRERVRRDGHRGRVPGAWRAHQTGGFARAR